MGSILITVRDFALRERLGLILDGVAHRRSELRFYASVDEPLRAWG